MPTKLINEIGNKYGSLTPISLTKDKNGRTAWMCQCDCGNTKIVRGSDLRKGKVTHCSKSCPCKTHPSFIDETGNTYGYLTVIKRDINSPSNKIQWLCQCSCGKKITVIGASLRQGRTKSCGCESGELLGKTQSLDLKGQQFGYLIPLKIEEYGVNRGNIWRCKCLCGCNREDVLVATADLTSGNTQSCGRIKRSHGEVEIEHFLQENSIPFKNEYTFSDLITNNNKKLRFDFGIFKNNKIYCLIEYDGRQHFMQVEHFGGEEKFQKQIEYDNLKNEYCKKQNIQLIRISYQEDIKKILNDFLKEYNNES
jgi:hypothetical protein